MISSGEDKLSKGEGVFKNTLKSHPIQNINKKSYYLLKSWNANKLPVPSIRPSINLLAPQNDLGNQHNTFSSIF